MNAIEIDRNFLRRCFLDLVKIPSPSGNEDGIRSYLKKKLESLGVAWMEDSAGRVSGYGFNNIFCTFEGRSQDGFPLAFLSHLDTVTPAEECEIMVEGDTVRTDGSSVLGADDKAGVALMLELARIFSTGSEQRPQEDVKLVFTGGEETGLYGAIGLDPTMLAGYSGIVLDCSRPVGSIITAGPGYQKIKAEFKGRAAHAGSSPDDGIHAHRMAAEAMISVKMGRIDGSSTRNFIFSSKAEKTNIIPEYAALAGELRSLDDANLRKLEKETFISFKDAAERVGGELTWSSNRSFGPYEVVRDEPLVRLCWKAFELSGLEPEICSNTGASDANILNEKGITAVNLGLSIDGAHSTRESYDMKNLDRLAKVLINVIFRGETW